MVGQNAGAAPVSLDFCTLLDRYQRGCSPFCEGSTLWRVSPQPLIEDGCPLDGVNCFTGALAAGILHLSVLHCGPGSRTNTASEAELGASE